MKRSGTTLLLASLAGLLLPALAFAQLNDASENPQLGAGTLAPAASPTQPGTIDSAGTKYYGPVRSFGARVIVFYITTADNDSLSVPAFEYSDDNLKYYSGAGEGTILSYSVDSKNINGRVSRIVIAPADQGSLGQQMSFLTSRYIKLKITALGAAVAGVAVKPIIVYDAAVVPFLDQVYDWTLPQ